MLQISRRAAQIAPSATLAIDTRAKALKAEGKDVVGFGAGEPDFDTPEYVRAAGASRHRRGQDALYARTGHALPAQDHRGEIPQGQRPCLRCFADHRLQRRQAVALHGVERARQRRRRGAHPLALLGQLPGNGENGGRRAGVRALLSRGRLHRSPRGDRKTRHGQDQGADPQQPQQPQWLRDPARNARENCRSRRGKAVLRHLRRDL